MLTPRLALKRAFGLLVLFALTLIVTALGSPPSAAAPAPLSRYADGPAGGLPATTPTPTAEPEYAILDYVKTNYPLWSCTGPLGTPGHRYLLDCNPHGVPTHPTRANIDRYDSPAEAQAVWQNRRDNVCPTFPLCVDSPYRSYQGYEAGNYNYPYAHHEHYLWGSVWLMGAESVDDTQYWGSPWVARAVIDAAIQLGYLSGGTATSTPTPTRTVTPSTTPNCAAAGGYRQNGAGVCGTLTPTPTCLPNWQQVPSPNASTADNYLVDVSAISPDDVWAVGYYSNTVTQRYETLTQHWNGSAWTIVPSPNPAGWHNYLRAVDGVVANDVWAVGDGRPNVGYGGGYLLTFHWDGSSWTAVRNPNPGFNYANGLSGVIALASNDVWATGFWRAYSFRGLLMHWDGYEWLQEIDPFYQGGLSDISGVASNDLWAVGHELSDGSLVYHRDGTGWSRISSPDVGGLGGVSALASNDVWAVGENGIIRWNGTSWVTMTVPVGGLLKVDARTANDVWVVASTAVLHWNGSQWTIRATAVGESLTGVDAVAANDVWAVGSRVEGGVRRTLIQRYTQGGCQTTTPTPVFTATATGTVPATPTASATSTSCTVQFPDVPPSNTFYPFVHCLACKGIVRGYPCGGTGEPCNPNNDPYFRPNNPITRGQIAKIVNYSAGFQEPIPPDQQTFEDVVYGSPFWEFIERLAVRGILSGYACGGPNEPCVPPANRPYFRPHAGATRGQLAKIDSEAAGFNDTIPETQYTFADVPHGHTFWLYIERVLLNRPNAISGYPCGGPNEPCDAENRPYFRPNNGVTRGQASKIVASTFFPGCNPP